MKKRYSVLIIDDHPLITSAYKSAFYAVGKQQEKFSFKIDVVHNCDTAYKEIADYSANNKKLDIVFLDIKLPPSKDKKITSGEELGIEINELLPETKIIVATSFDDNYRIYSLLKSLDPDGFLIKNDINPKELVATINTVLNNTPYYSKTVTKLLRKEVTTNLLLDDVDRKLLYELSLGTMMKDLPEVLLLSLPALEKRKRRLKKIFDAEGPSNKELLIEAKEKGFL